MPNVITPVGKSLTAKLPSGEIREIGKVHKAQTNDSGDLFLAVQVTDPQVKAALTGVPEPQES